MDDLMTVRALGGGHFVENLADALRRLASEVREKGKAGGLSVSFKVDTTADETMVTVGYEMKLKPPAAPAMGSMFFVNEDGFHRNDPRQQELPEFKLVEETGELVKPEDYDEAVKEAASDD